MKHITIEFDISEGFVECLQTDWVAFESGDWVDHISDDAVLTVSDVVEESWQA